MWPGIRPLSLPPSVFFGTLARLELVKRVTDGKGHTDEEILARTLREDWVSR